MTFIFFVLSVSQSLPQPAWLKRVSGLTGLPIDTLYLTGLIILVWTLASLWSFGEHVREVRWCEDLDRQRRERGHLK